MEKNTLTEISGAVADEMEELAARLIERFPSGYLTPIEVGSPCKMAVRAPLRGLDTPRVILTGSYRDLRAFENTYRWFRMRTEEKSPLDQIT